MFDIVSELQTSNRPLVAASTPIYYMTGLLLCAECLTRENTDNTYTQEENTNTQSHKNKNKHTHTHTYLHTLTYVGAHKHTNVNQSQN